MKTEKIELRTLWTVKETAIYLRKSVKTIRRRLKSDHIKGFKEGKNGNILIYADTVIEENLNSTKPKFKNNL
jgi:hypothetical protein